MIRCLLCWDFGMSTMCGNYHFGPAASLAGEPTRSDSKQGFGAGVLRENEEA